MFTVSELIERAESEGIVTSLRSEDYQSDANREVGFDWDAYPYTSQTV